MIKLKEILTEKKKMGEKGLLSTKRMTDKNQHTENRKMLSKLMKNKQHEKGIDMQTANLIVTIHKAYNKNKPLQKKFEKIPLKKMKELILRYMS